MKKKLIALLLVVSLCAMLLVGFCACNNDNSNKPSQPVEIIPTADDVVSARAAEVENTNQQYDFYINLNGSVGDFVSANANYDGKYRYNSQTGDLKFRRETSGALLYDSIEYIYSQGDARVKVKMNERSVVKKVSVESNKDDELNLINLPFVAIVNALKAENLGTIKKNSNSTFSQYKYCATMALASNNNIINKVLDKIDKMGTSISIKNVTFSNPQNGVTLYFNYTSGQPLTDFAYAAKIGFPFKGQSVELTLSYKQSKNTNPISLPSVSGFSTSKSEISSDISTIKTAISSLKSASTYSLDLTAVNDFDPSATKNAIVDKYIARMYKNTNDGRVDFNHSFKYKAHSEEDGKEAYQYTYGNVQTDNKVYLISRKGKNTQTEVSGITADTQFDYLTSAIILNANSIDCIKKENVSAGTKYSICLNDTQTLAVQDIICDIINSNTAEGVVLVDNKFNPNDYSIEDAEYTIIIKNGALVSIECNTKIKFYPTGGEYSDYHVTLKNSITLEVNKKASAAADYSAPLNVNTTLGHYGLNNGTYYYIL